MINPSFYLSFFNTECPPAMDGMERFACPSPDRQGRYRCIDDHVLCDGFIDCPKGEDEERQACMFYKTVSSMGTQRIYVTLCGMLVWLEFKSIQMSAHTTRPPKLNEVGKLPLQIVSWL